MRYDKQEQLAMMKGRPLGNNIGIKSHCKMKANVPPLEGNSEGCEV